MVLTGLFGNDLLALTIVDGARPARRRMSSGLQNLLAEMSGSRHTRSTFHPGVALPRLFVLWMKC